jgi:hypothetical protein
MRYFIIQIFILHSFLIGIRESLKYDTQNFQSEGYSKYVNSKLKNKEQKISGIDYEESIKYLGKLKLENRKVYFVLTSFKTIQGAIIKHGQSKIIFLEDEKKIERQYIVDLPEQLPFKIGGDKLFFKNYGSKDNIIITKLGHDLPDLLCIGDHDCYPYQQ